VGEEQSLSLRLLTLTTPNTDADIVDGRLKSRCNLFFHSFGKIRSLHANEMESNFLGLHGSEWFVMLSSHPIICC